MNEPDVALSIVVPTYNRAHLIRSTLLSLLAQTESSFEIIVVDDGGGDDTEAVVGTIGDSPRELPLEDQRRAGPRATTARCEPVAATSTTSTRRPPRPNHLTEARALIALRDRPAAFHLLSEVRTADGRPVGVNRPVADRVTGRIPPRAVLAATCSHGRHVSAPGRGAVPSVAEIRTLAGSEDWVLWLRLIARFPIFENAEPTSTLIQHDARQRDGDARRSRGTNAPDTGARRIGRGVRAAVRRRGAEQGRCAHAHAPRCMPPWADTAWHRCSAICRPRPGCIPVSSFAAARWRRSSTMAAPDAGRHGP